MNRCKPTVFAGSATSRQERGRKQLNRRDVLKLGASVMVSGGLLGGCRTGEASSEDTPRGTLTENPLGAELARYDALGQAELFRSGEISALELVEAAIERIERLDPVLNCVVHEAFDHARAEAQIRSPEDGPFAGVPYLLKCLEAREGMPYTMASRFLAANVAEESDPVTAAAEEAGLIYLGNSSSPEFGLIASTAPTLYGACNNPFDLERSPAGSSGGSAALVAAGVVPIATADDGGGSIRLPASTCGTVGLKYSRERELGHEESFLVNTACESRTMRDTATFLDAIENKAHPDLPPVGLIDGPSSKRLRIGWSAGGNDLSYAPDPEVAAAIEETAKLLESLGHEVEEARFEVDGDIMKNQFMVLWCAGAAQTVARARETLGREPDEREFEAWTLGLAREAETHPEDGQEKAMAYFEDLRQRYEAWFSSYDVQLTPVTRSPAQLAAVQDPRREDYDQLREEVWAWVNYTPLHNLVGAPSMSLPLSQSAAGLPIGSLLSGAWGSEATLLHLGFELEAARPWRERWPQYSVFATPS